MKMTTKHQVLLQLAVAAAIFIYIQQITDKQSNYIHLMRNEMIAPFVSLEMVFFFMVLYRQRDVVVYFVHLSGSIK